MGFVCELPVLITELAASFFIHNGYSDGYVILVFASSSRRGIPTGAVGGGYVRLPPAVLQGAQAGSYLPHWSAAGLGLGHCSTARRCLTLEDSCCHTVLTKWSGPNTWGIALISLWIILYCHSHSFFVVVVFSEVMVHCTCSIGKYIDLVDL